MLFFVGYFNPRQSGISIDASPSSSVYINGQLVGQTPYETVRKPSEITVKLIPANLNTFFETKVTLTPGIKTIIKRDFGQTDNSSSGEIVSFEKDGGNASIAIISVPDGVNINVDGMGVGTTPYKNNAITSVEHQVTLSKDGFIQKVFNVKAYSGFKLTAIVQLAKSQDNSQSSLPNPSTAPDPKLFEVEILPTPNGFLRVRSSANVTSSELAKLKPGDKYPLIDQDGSGAWYEITYSEGKNGWISSAFARKVEQ